MPPRLVALDLDGTLLRPDGRVAGSSLRVLRAVSERGIRVALCTGRSVGSARAIARHLAAHIGQDVPAVACNGAAVLDGAGRLVTQRPIPGPALTEALAILRNQSLLVACYGDQAIYLEHAWRHLRALLVEGRGQPWWLWRGAGAAWRFGVSNRIRPVRSLLQWAASGRPTVLKVFAFAAAAGPFGRSQRAAESEPVAGEDPAEMPGLAAVRAEMARRVPLLHLTSSGRGNLELMAAGAHKGWGLRVLAEVLRVPRSDVMAVGDAPNDVEMLHYAGVAVAMGGSPPELARIAHHVTASAAEDGVAAALERYCLNQAGE